MKQLKDKGIICILIDILSVSLACSRFYEVHTLVDLR